MIRLAPFALLFALVAAPVHAGMIDLGFGWQAEWEGFDIDVVPLGAADGVLYLRKIAKFTPQNMSGIDIDFVQYAPCPITAIAIEDEYLVNNTGHDWQGFSWGITPGEYGDAHFDEAATLASGGFTVDPFASMAFSPGNLHAAASQGLVPAGAVWTPGNYNQQPDRLFIAVDAANVIGEPFASFSLLETPTVPAPAAAVLLLAPLFGSRRRRA